MKAGGKMRNVVKWVKSQLWRYWDDNWLWCVYNNDSFIPVFWDLLLNLSLIIHNNIYKVAPMPVTDKSAHNMVKSEKMVKQSTNQPSQSSLNIQCGYSSLKAMTHFDVSLKFDRHTLIWNHVSNDTKSCYQYNRAVLLGKYFSWLKVFDMFRSSLIGMNWYIAAAYFLKKHMVYWGLVSDDRNKHNPNPQKMLKSQRLTIQQKKVLYVFMSNYMAFYLDLTRPW